MTSGNDAPPRSAEPRPIKSAPQRSLDALSSNQTGIVLLVLLLAYCAIGSGYLPFRRALELSETGVFTWWPFAGLVLVFCIVLALATVRRVRFTLVNAGVICIHVGVLVLVIGAAYYFGSKVEGDVLLRPPMVHLLSAQRFRQSGDPARSMIGQLVAAEGCSWRQNIPALGGAHEIQVVSVVDKGMQLAREVTLRVQIADQPQHEVTLTAEADQAVCVPISDHLLGLLETPTPATHFYEAESPALYVTFGDHQYVLPIAGLPIHNERYLASQGEYVYDTGGHVVDGGASSSVPLLDRWRMPIPLDADGLPFDVTITGYLPYVTWVEAFVGGGEALNPVAQVRLQRDSQEAVANLVANDPAESLWQSIEFVWVTDGDRLAALSAPLAGPRTLDAYVKDADLHRQYAVEPGQQIDVEATGYQLTVDRLIADWPMMSPGYQGARSPVAQVTVRRGDLQFQRTVIQRFEQLSQDIDAEGVRHREGLVDDNIELRYFDASSGWYTLVAGPAVDGLHLIITRSDGMRELVPLEVGKTILLADRGSAGRLTVLKVETHARRVTEPRVVPRANRRPQMGQMLSAVRVELSEADASGQQWTRSVWLPFSQYLHDFAEPRTVSLPSDDGSPAIELTYARRMRSLPGPIALEQMQAIFFPGRERVNDWHSYFRFRLPGGEVHRSMVRLNHTAVFGPWTLFQAAEAPDHESYSVLGVGNRPGIVVMLLGCVLLTLGMLYAFFVKPVLKRRRTGGEANQAVESTGVAL
jgi:hypothetical protein